MAPSRKDRDRPTRAGRPIHVPHDRRFRTFAVAVVVLATAAVLLAALLAARNDDTSAVPMPTDAHRSA